LAHAACLRAWRTCSSTDNDSSTSASALGVEQRPTELHQSVPRSKAVATSETRVREFCLELQHNTLRSLQPDPGDGLEALHVVARDRATELSGSRARDDRQRHLRPHAVHAQQKLEQLALVGGREAVELQRVLTDDGVHLDRDLALAQAMHRGSRVHEVADAVHIDDERLPDPPGRRPAEPGDHDATARQRRGERMADRDRKCVGGGCGVDVVEAEDGLHHLPPAPFSPAVPTDGLFDRRRRVFSARDAGGRCGDEHGSARLPDGECDAGVGADVRLLQTTASGACWAISSWTPMKIVSSRVHRSRGDVRHHPWQVALRRPSLPWTIPYPHAAVPGSMPRTFTTTR
jgi:hypothetical protein